MVTLVIYRFETYAPIQFKKELCLSSPALHLQLVPIFLWLIQLQQFTQYNAKKTYSLALVS